MEKSLLERTLEAYLEMRGMPLGDSIAPDEADFTASLQYAIDPIPEDIRLVPSNPHF